MLRQELCNAGCFQWSMTESRQREGHARSKMLAALALWLVCVPSLARAMVGPHRVE